MLTYCKKVLVVLEVEKVFFFTHFSKEKEISLLLRCI